MWQTAFDCFTLAGDVLLNSSCSPLAKQSLSLVNSLSKVDRSFSNATTDLMQESRKRIMVADMQLGLN